MKRFFKSQLFAFIMGVVLTASTVVCAAVLIVANNIIYTPRDSEWNVETVEDALDDLYNMALNNNGSSNFIGISFNFDYTGSYQTFTVPVTGEYKVELWGAQGGTSNSNTSYGQGGLGGYTAGTILLDKDDTLLVYVGGQGKGNVTSSNYSTTGGWNGGGYGSYRYVCAGGGGATDIRKTTDVNDRIMVAAGGGGDCSQRWGSANYSGGAGGGLTGQNGLYNNSTYIGIGATQTSGGVSNISAVHNGSYYQGCNSPVASDDRAGGGGGYYGGSCSYGSYGGGGGGSSFISGHQGCDAIDSNGTHTGQPNHYLDYVFSQTRMIDGTGHEWTTEAGSQTNQPQPSGDDKVGHSGNGYARITYMG